MASRPDDANEVMCRPVPILLPFVLEVIPPLGRALARKGYTRDNLDSVALAQSPHMGRTLEGIAAVLAERGYLSRTGRPLAHLIAGKSTEPSPGRLQEVD